MGKKLILASQSEGRKRLLEEAGFEFEVVVSDFDEEAIKAEGFSPEELVKKLSIEKARTVLSSPGRQGPIRIGSRSRSGTTYIILAGDQVVQIGEDIVGKPKDERDARKRFAALENSYADCIEGYAIIDTESREEIIGEDTARIYFGTIPKDELSEWLSRESPYKKAGGFSVGEEPSAGWVIKIEGERSTITGMPMHIVTPILKRLLEA